MWASALPVHSRSRPNSTTKYIVAHQDHISTSSPTATNEWPSIMGALKPPIQRETHRALEGILKEHSKVVIKLTVQNNGILADSVSQSIYKEYRITEELRGIPGFIRPYCYFECEDSYTKVLVLPFFEEGSMRSCNWTKKPFALLHACLLQCIGSLFQAYDTKGILHSDTHLDNVLLKKTTIGEVEYTFGGHTIQVPTEGYMIAIMDFEISVSEIPTNRGQAIGQLYDDVLHAVFDLRYNDSSDIVGDTELITTLMALKAHPENVYTAWQTLYPLVLKVKAIPKVSRSFTYDPFAF